MNPDKIIQLVHETRPLIMDTENTHKITIKGQADFVTRVDTSVQQFIQKALAGLYPDIQFIGEEDHMNTIDPSRPAWILDPIDGTTNLIYDFQHSAVSLGYYENGRIQLGVVYNPFTEETFHAVRDQGAYLNGHPIHCNPTEHMADSLISIGTSPYDREMAAQNFKVFQKIFEHSLDIRRTGSAALDLSYVACGRLDGYIERNLKPWDFAAGALILEEAGGKITNYQKQPVDYCKNQDILASNGHIHDEIAALL